MQLTLLLICTAVQCEYYTQEHTFIYCHEVAKEVVMVEY